VVGDTAGDTIVRFFDPIDGKVIEPSAVALRSGQLPQAGRARAPRACLDQDLPARSMRVVFGGRWGLGHRADLVDCVRTVGGEVDHVDRQARREPA